MSMQGKENLESERSVGHKWKRTYSVDSSKTFHCQHCGRLLACRKEEF